MPDFSFESHYGRDAGKIIGGVDEVGRGPLAGPVFAAVAVIPNAFPERLKAQIQDSKKLTAKKRDALYDDLRALCPHAIAEATVEEIDGQNILRASLLAMRRAVESLGFVLDAALVDGNQKPPLTCPVVTIVGGDDKSLSIATASIIAKVARDRFMQKLAEEHPCYGWNSNAGYGTKEHLAAIERHGVTRWHRRSFAPIRKKIND